ncbi:MAG: PKD domain-containing protein [Bacteroidetes bacterium]|nr:PKD domain-containing protein [Bacteroidota bacterium]
MNMKNYQKSRSGKSMFLILAFVLVAFAQVKAGCNFGITAKTHAGLNCNITIGQGPWGPRMYTWQFGDGTTGISYSNASNTTAIAHTYPGSGVYTMTITSQDSTGGGCVSWITDTIQVSGGTFSPCAPQFTYWVDSTNCSVHIVNQSTGGSSPTYDWVCFDGNGYYYVNNQANPVLTFTTSGNHYVSLYQNDGGVFCDSISQLIVMPASCGGTPVGNGCTAQFFASQTSGTNCWQFTNQSTSTSPSVSYTWHFGDGSSSTQANPIHCYTDSLAYHLITLWMSASNGCSDSVSVSVIDSSFTGGNGGAGCNTQFYYWVDSTTCDVHFMNQSTNATSFQWYFFDGVSTYTFTSFSPVLPFPSNTGAVYATLYGFNNGQFCDSISHTVYFPTSCGGSGNPTGGSCNAQFILINDSINTHTYYAYNSSTGTGLSYLWDFGDGSTSTLQYPSHTYATAGNYVVCLTVTGSNSCTSTYCDSNNVQKIAASHLMQYLIAKPANATGIQNLEKQVMLSLYPNPAVNELTIESTTEIQAVKVSDISGKIVLKQGNIGSMEHRLSISSLDAGSYFLEISTKDGGKAVKRFVKIAD